MAPEQFATECFSLTTTQAVPSTDTIPTPPLSRRFLGVLELAPDAYLREASRLWGLSPDPAIRSAWQEFLALADTAADRNAPAWAQKLIRRRLALWDGESVYLPLSVLVALSSPEPSWDLQVFQRMLQWIRRQLATQAAQKRDASEYRAFARFLSAPRMDPNELLLYRSVDLPSLARLDTSPGTWLVPAAKAFCITFRQQNPDAYEEICTAQQPIWEAYGDGLQGLTELLREATTEKPSAREGDYDTSCRGARSVLDLLADAFHLLGRFERRMGVDRYMAPALVQAELESLHSFVRDVRRQVNNNLDAHRLLFQRDWGNHRIADIVRRLFGQVPSDPFLSRFPTNQRRVILLVIDGFGYVQYRWNQLMSRDRRHTTFGGSVLDFLAEQPEYSDNWILGGPLITDTGAGLSQIFSGLPSRENGVYSSQLSDGRGSFFDVKRVQSQAEWADKVDGRFPLTFFDSLEKVRVHVLASGASSRPSAFAQRNWGDHPAEPVDPPERFPQVLLQHLGAADKRRQLYVVYYPLIDRHGHNLGSFSSFELHEYERLNLMLSSLLLQVLSLQPGLFDGQTTLLITADHGMFESAGGTITRDEVLSKLETSGLRPPKVAIANRAIFLFGVRNGELQATEQALGGLFRSKQMEVQFVSRTHRLYRELIYAGEDFPARLPDLIILLKGEGLAVTRPIPAPTLHFGGHGGCSAEEVFVPAVTTVLTPRLADALRDRYGRLT